MNIIFIAIIIFIIYIIYINIPKQSYNIEFFYNDLSNNFNDTSKIINTIPLNFYGDIPYYYYDRSIITSPSIYNSYWYNPLDYWLNPYLYNIYGRSSYSSSSSSYPVRRTHRTHGTHRTHRTNRTNRTHRKHRK